METASVDTPSEDQWIPLPDVSGLPIQALAADDSGVLGRSLRQVLGTLADRDGVISAFASFVSTD
ncbi:hypothetical protein [Actinoplanes utahensis]|uniref:FXSXX-COOH protein n=1 Tax=Actinoplanes utahensis TaxID=1869 RepID=A0A0A6UF46_ACTUT|nr:hypothetical protein [Actinoplanes utahensis]KHD74660.1 hypothetical protein MB27_27630 [Actinoplanes utahensis]GIF31491.1 hypothetical protein Aut01nite_44770 [Actinoplanes utahensis]